MLPIGIHCHINNRDVQLAVGAILGPHNLFSTLHWCHYSSCYFEGLAKSSPEKQTVNILHFTHRDG